MRGPVLVTIAAIGSALLSIILLWGREPKASGSMVATIGGARFTLDRKETPMERGHGLKGIPFLGPDRGAMFRDPARPNGKPVAIIMDGCQIPLDIVFLDQAQRIQRVETARPGAPEAFTVVGPMLRSRYQAYRDSLAPSWAVLEIQAGRATELRLKQGDSVSFPVSTP